MERDRSARSLVLPGVSIFEAGLSRRIWSAVNSLHSEPEPLPGRGASLLIWSPHLPISFTDFHRTWKTIWPVLSANLLGISTRTSQDIIFYGPLLLPAERALLVLGLALLLWHWRHPAAFLILASGFGRLACRRHARGVSEQCATSNQSLDSCLPSLLRCVGTARMGVGNGWQVRIRTPLALDIAGRHQSELRYSCLAGAI